MTERAIEELEFGLLQISAGARQRAGLASALQQYLDLALPSTPNATTGDEARWACWFGPGQWLVGWDRSRAQSKRCPDLSVPDGALVVDVSDAYRVWRLSGPAAANWLAQGCPLDLDSPALVAGRCARSQFDQFPLFLHRRSEQTFDLYMLRSYAEHFAIRLGSTDQRPD